LQVHITWEFIAHLQLHKSIQSASTPQKLKLLSVTHKNNIHLGHSLYVAETWTIRKEDQQYLERLKVWYWRIMGKISWNECVKNEVLGKGRTTFYMK
jgi:hypothetical protein